MGGLLGEEWVGSGFIEDIVGGEGEEEEEVVGGKGGGCVLLF